MSKVNIRARGIRATAATGLLLLALAVCTTAIAQQRSIVDLARAGNTQAVLEAIASPETDVNATSPDGSTALMWATFNVDHELVKALLEAGARPDASNSFGATALTEAIRLRDMELFRMLLEAGADPDSPNLDNQTALMLATSYGAVDMVRMLIEKGADVTAVENFRGQTALMWAAGYDQPEIVDLLLANGAAEQIDLRAKHDDWPRQMTSEPRAQFAARHTGGLTALLYAARSGCHRCALSLIEAGADIMKPNPDGVTPLINALDNRRFDMAMHLLDMGANPHAWDMSGRTPLYVAVNMNTFGGGGPGAGGPDGPGGPFSSGEVDDDEHVNRYGAMDVIHRLLEKGVDVNHQLNRKRPYGAGRGRFADYDLRGGAGPLMLATIRNDHEVMQLLIEHGAEVDLRNAFRMTPLMLAAGMAGTARGGGGGGGLGPSEEAQRRAIRTIDVLLDAGADINAQINDSRTRNATIQSYVQGRDQEGRTALIGAAEIGSHLVVKHLLERGANPTLLDAEGIAALDVAREEPAGNLQPAVQERLAAGRGAAASHIEAALATFAAAGTASAQ